MIAIDLRKRKALYTNPKAIQQINFTANLDWSGSAITFFIIEEAKETILDFSQGAIRVILTKNFECIFRFNMQSG